MYWGAFCKKGVSVLVPVYGNQNADKYQQTLKNHLLPFKNACFQGSCIFMQDGASIHTANSTKQWLEDNDITIMDWPAHSPDLNPIENLCGNLSRAVYQQNRQFKNVHELHTCVMDAWGKITRKDCYDLVASMPRRVYQVTERQKKKTDY